MARSCFCILFVNNINDILIILVVNSVTVAEFELFLEGSCSAGIVGLTRGLANLLQGNVEPLVVKDKVGISSGELRVRKSIECDTFPLQCSAAVGWKTAKASGL